MKTFFYIFTFVFLIVLILSCSKDVVKKEIQQPEFTPTSSWTGRDTVHCGGQNSFEYDFLAMLHEHDLPGLDTILWTELGNSEYENLKEQIIIADSIGIEAWYTQYVGEGPNGDLIHELDSITVFFKHNYSNNYFASLVDSLINDYVSDQRFDIEEKQLLSAYALTLSTWWEISKCKEKDYQVRNGDDGRLCNFTEACGLANIATGAIAGGIVGYVVEFVQKEFWFGNRNGAVTAIAALLGAYLGNQLDLYNCFECDDCHHPNIISYQVDYTHCRISGARFFGSFEFAEDWEWNVVSQNGNFSGHNPLEPRAWFPGTFNPGGFSWQITARTVCDGHTYPDNNKVGFTATFDSNLPRTPLSIRGSVIANRTDDVEYITSTSFNGHLHDPSWTVSEGMDIIESGEENGSYYVIVNFSEVTTARGEIYLTIYDDCHGGNIERTKSVRLDHE